MFKDQDHKLAMGFNFVVEVFGIEVPLGNDFMLIFIEINYTVQAPGLQMRKF